MIDWTPAAQAEIERYLARLSPKLEAAGADPTEVKADIQRHVEEELAAAKIAVATEHEVRQILERVGEPDLTGDPTSSLPPKEKIPMPPSPRPRALFLLIFGCILPLITLLIEVCTGMCAAAFFDPIPTVGHIILVAIVPLANGLLWRATTSGSSEGLRRLGWLNGMAAGIALFYSLIFLPLTPVAMVAIIWLGWGLLPLSPLLAFLATLRGRFYLRALTPEPATPRGLWGGCGIALLVLMVLNLPVTLTKIGMQLASSPEREIHQRGIRWLRQWGHDGSLLRACYGQTRRAANMDPIQWLTTGGKPIPAQQARRIYYQVTGEAFNAVPPPKIRTGRGTWRALDDFTWDADQGGTTVGGRVRGLTLSASRQDGFIDSRMAFAYTEWILEFDNRSPRIREARAQIALPPGGVVSRLTLWIDGEEKEAAFAGRGQVRKAYQEVVHRQRDPVLVTTSGPDRILIQCFPVPPSGQMKVRLGITAPLSLETAAKGFYRWPIFLERNFTIPLDFTHSLWLESDVRLVSDTASLKSETSPDGRLILRGQLADRELGNPRNVLRINRQGQPTVAWSRDERDPVRPLIQQTVSEIKVEKPDQVIFVIDTSRGMARHLPEVSKALESLPGDLAYAVLLARDGRLDLSAAVKSSEAISPSQVAEWLRTTPCQGGQDNAPALVQAWDLASSFDRGVVLWIHQPQPESLERLDPLQQRLERSPLTPRVYEIQTEPGPNRLLENLDGYQAVQSVPRLGELSTDLRRVVAGWQQGGQGAIQRVKLDPAATVPPPNYTEGSFHLVRLWAFDEIKRRTANREFRAATELATRYQLVTPISGAVVLETDEQYQRAGLTPVDPTTVPSIPEPGTLLLLIMALTALCLRRWISLRGPWPRGARAP